MAWLEGNSDRTRSSAACTPTTPRLIKTVSRERGTFVSHAHDTRNPKPETRKPTCEHCCLLPSWGIPSYPRNSPTIYRYRYCSRVWTRSVPRGLEDGVAGGEQRPHPLLSCLHQNLAHQRQASRPAKFGKLERASGCESCARLEFPGTVKFDDARYMGSAVWLDLWVRGERGGDRESEPARAREATKHKPLLRERGEGAERHGPDYLVRKVLTPPP